MDIRPTHATLGATVTNIDLRTLSANAFAELETAWHEYAVLIFPAQHLDDEAHIAFSRRFGPLERLQTTAVEGAHPEIFMASNVGPDGRIDPVGSACFLHNKGNRIWHSDSSFKSNPAKASVFRADAVPHEGGETEFADMRALTMRWTGSGNTGSPIRSRCTAIATARGRSAASTSCPTRS